MTNAGSLTGFACSYRVDTGNLVAEGLAVQAGVLCAEVEDVMMLDVVPNALGIETVGGVFTPVIPRNTTIPTKRSVTFSTAVDNQSAVSVKIYEQSSAQAEKSNLAADAVSITTFDCNGIPPAPKGVPEIEITFDIDCNRVLQVCAVEKTSGKKLADETYRTLADTPEGRLFQTLQGLGIE